MRENGLFNARDRIVQIGGNDIHVQSERTLKRCLNRGIEMCVNRGNELQSERTNCLIWGNELTTRENMNEIPTQWNELIIRENGSQNLIKRFTNGLLKISIPGLSYERIVLFEGSNCNVRERIVLFEGSNCNARERIVKFEGTIYNPRERNL